MCCITATNRNNYSYISGKEWNSEKQLTSDMTRSFDRTEDSHAHEDWRRQRRPCIKIELEIETRMLPQRLDHRQLSVFSIELPSSSAKNSISASDSSLAENPIKAWAIHTPTLNPLTPIVAFWRHTYFRHHNFIKKC